MFGTKPKQGKSKKGKGFFTNERLAGCSNPKYVPIADVSPEEVFDFVYITNEETIKYLNEYGRIVFVLRGPSGTRKGLLCDLILKTYKKSFVCTAYDYFSSPLAVERNRETVRESHQWCIKRLNSECEKGVPSIILKNTHIRKYELEPYLDVIRNHHYTVVMAETVRKFRVNKEILEKSNRKGLNADYLGRRLGQWEEIIPWFTGWFLNPADSKWLFEKSQEVLSVLAENEEFKNAFPASENIKNKFCQETSVFCIAAYCNVGLTNEGRANYLNEEVQNNVGKMFPLIITSLVIWKNMLIAAVQLSPAQHKITLLGKDTSALPSKKESRNPEVEMLKNLKIKDDYGILNKDIKAIETTHSALTFEIKEREDNEYFSSLAKSAFMLLGRDCKDTTSPLFTEMTNTVDLSHNFSILMEDGATNEAINVDEYRIHKVNEMLIIELNCNYVGKSVFTGLF